MALPQLLLELLACISSFAFVSKAPAVGTCGLDRLATGVMNSSLRDLVCSSITSELHHVPRRTLVQGRPMRLEPNRPNANMIKHASCRTTDHTTAAKGRTFVWRMRSVHPPSQVKRRCPSLLAQQRACLANISPPLKGLLSPGCPRTVNDLLAGRCHDAFSWRGGLDLTSLISGFLLSGRSISGFCGFRQSNLRIDGKAFATRKHDSDVQPKTMQGVFSSLHPGWSFDRFALGNASYTNTNALRLSYVCHVSDCLI